MDPDAGELIEFGAQAERTALAWERTGLGLVAIGALTVRWSLREGFPAWPGVLLAAFSGLAALVLVRQRYLRVMKTVRAGQTPLSRYLVRGAALYLIAVVGLIGAGVGVELSRL